MHQTWLEKRYLGLPDCTKITLYCSNNVHSKESYRYDSFRWLVPWDGVALHSRMKKTISKDLNLINTMVL